jgi:RHS repeat-associated protein
VGSTRIHSFYNYTQTAWTWFETTSTNAGCTNNPFGDSFLCYGSLIDGFYFTDQLQSSLTNYTHFPNRDYSTTQGRWIHPDPAGIDATDLTNPQTWDRYTYVLNNPLSFIDPLGLDCIYDNGDGTVTVLTTDDGGASNGGSGADCSDPNDNGYYVDGTIDQNSTFYEDQGGNLQFGYTNTSGNYGTYGINGFADPQNPDQQQVTSVVQGIAANTAGFPNICSGGAFAYAGVQGPLGKKGGHGPHGFIGYLGNYDSKEGSSNNLLVEGSKGNASGGVARGSKGTEGLVFLPFFEAGGGLLGFSKNGLSVGVYIGTPENFLAAAGGGGYLNISTMGGCRGR